LIVGIVGLHLVLRGIAPAPSTNIAQRTSRTRARTSRNLRARNTARAKRNRAIRENFAK
jgi:hypothetical protein